MALQHDIGSLGEAIAEQFLVERGCSIVERNAFVDGDELDLIVHDGLTLVAVEVKTTSNGDDPFEAIDDVKAYRVRRAANGYRLPVHRIDVVGVMIDSVGVTIHWVPAML